MDGVYISVVRLGIERSFAGRTCTRVAAPFAGALELVFGGVGLVFDGRPPAPSVWAGESRREDDPGPLQPWSDHLAGARLDSVEQFGLDRVLRLAFSRTRTYGNPGAGVIFELTGRNCNIILVGAEGRIMASTRTVTRGVSRVRTIAPGAQYHRPPPSGEALARWGEPWLLEALDSAAGARDIYSVLEGVGPSTAEAVLEESCRSGRSVSSVIGSLAGALACGEFSPWAARQGPMPIRLGEGQPITDVLSPPSSPAGRGGRTGALEDILRTRRAFLVRKLERLGAALEGVQPADQLRLWGNLILANSAGIPAGVSEARLTDWTGVEHLIPLRPRRSPVENAQRFFRKARNTDLEIRRLAESRGDTERAVEEIDRALEEGPHQAGPGLLRAVEKRTARAGREGPARRDLGGGWSCLVGRSAAENEEVTFGLARKDDIWLHARGTPGAHVVLRHDSRPENPPKAVLEAAAAIAAASVRNHPEVVPVDYTHVRHVRKFKGAAAGEVVYSAERTLFVRVCRTRRGQAAGKGEK